ncbi:MAG TPA: hypothetical protein VHA09_01665 [Nitrososphaera sp.]|nr:hypothetical protein [Nitrososphaera sp.]
MDAKESAVAKSIGPQERKDMLPQDSALYRVIASKKKFSKRKADYHHRTGRLRPSSPRVMEKGRDPPYHYQEDTHHHHYLHNRRLHAISCIKCKFNLGDEGKCHIVSGVIDNEHGISKFFSPKGVGMLPGDVVWEFVKNTRNKLAYREGHVIRNGAPGFQCKDCKYYLYSRNCLLIKGKFRPEMSCGFIVKAGNGTEV